MIPAVCIVFVGFMLMVWVGWRFFYAPVRAAPAQVAGGEAKADKPVEILTTASKDVVLNTKTGFQGWRFLKWPLIVILTTLLIVGMTLRMAGRYVLAGFDAPQTSNRHIEAALTEEKLVPPPALPPSVFLNSEKPELAGVDRDWSKLDQGFAQVVLRLMAVMQDRGYNLVLVEGYRSPERQEELASSGRNVTHARGGQSKHQYGLAVDLAPMRDGHIVLSEQDPWALGAYQAMGEEAAKLGLTWGGNWSFKDYGHVESPKPVPHGSSKQE